MGSGGNAPRARQTLNAGENMKQLTEVRRVLEKELGTEACKRIRTPLLHMDLLLVNPLSSQKPLRFPIQNTYTNQIKSISNSN
jgi:hypothetical protein